ncbi:hypothetical protein HNQ56_001147 [Anaerotaenia torta]|uniref:hypothetical protein n=1 Tax=Anaerotaenia torta TaxID=433293 RepID=UPI003D19177C
MAHQNYLHIAEIMKASLPYFDSASRVRLEFFSKLLDLMGNLSAISRNSMVACGYESTHVDVEGLLNGIRPVCNNRERDFVDRILNIFNMRRMFEMYNNIMNMMNAMNAMQEFEGFSFTDDMPKDDTDNVTSNFTNTNFESIFRAFNQGGSDTQDAFSQHRQEGDDVQDTFSARRDENDLGSKDDFSQNEDGFGSQDDFSRQQQEASSRQQEAPSGKNNSFMPNNAMFDMLKTMVPPEQANTFENIRMLLNTMSYDGNSKSDNSKEHENG